MGALGGLSQVADSMQKDRMQEHEDQLNQAKQLSQTLDQMLADPTLAHGHNFFRMAKVKLATKGPKAVNEILRDFQMLKEHGDSEEAKAYLRQKGQPNLPQPMAPPPGVAPQAASAPAQLTPPPGDFISFRSPDEQRQHEAEMARQAQAAGIAGTAAAYQAAGLRPPSSFAGQPKFQVRRGQPLPGEAIGREPGKYYFAVDDMNNPGVPIDYVETGPPSTVQTGQREGWTKEGGQFVRVVLDRNGKTISKHYDLLPPAQYLDKVTQTTVLVPQADNSIVQVPKTTRTGPAIPELSTGAAPATSKGNRGASAPGTTAPSGKVVGERGLTPQQRQTAGTGISTLDAALGVIDRIRPLLDRLKDPVRGIHLQAALSAARKAQEGGLLNAAYTAALTRTLEPQDKKLLGYWISGLEHVQRMRAVMVGAAGFRSAEAFETLLNQLGNPAIDPATTTQTMGTTYDTLRGYREVLRSSLQSTKGMTPPPAGSETTAGKHYVGEEVTLRGGTKITIKKVHPDGSFE